MGFRLDNTGDTGATGASFADGLFQVYSSSDGTKLFKFSLTGSTTGTTTRLLTSSTVSRDITLPNATDTLVGRATTDTLTNKSMSGAANTFTNIPLTTAVTGVLPVANGGTNSSTALNNNRIMISSAGAIVEQSALGASAPMRTNASGLPTTGNIALGSEVSGQLPLANGGTNANLTAINGGMVYSDASKFVILAAGSAGQILTSGGAGAPVWVTLVPLANGGTNAALTAVNGGVAYSDASKLQLTAAGTSGQYLKSAGAAAPTWSSFAAPTTQVFTATGTTAGRAFIVTAANATVGATYTNNGQTFTVLGTIAGGTTLFCSGVGAPTASGTLTKASGTGDATITFSSSQTIAQYTLPANVLFIEVECVGAGGGGAGGGSTQPNGSNGGNTYFGINQIIAGGGIAANGSNGGNGGTASATGLSGVVLGGGKGTSGGANSTAVPYAVGGAGGASTYGGNGGGGIAAAGTAGNTNTGGGGGGGSGANSASHNGGGGGGSGGCVKVLITSPASTYYAVGTGGGGGSAGTSGYAGAAGADGVLVIREFYQ